MSNSENTQYVAVFTTNHPWVKQVVHEVKRDDIQAVFIDLSDDAAAEEWLPKADFVVCTVLPTDRAKMLTKCRLVHHNGVGYDGVDHATLLAMGIPLCVTPQYTAEGVAEHVFMMMLALSKQLVPAHSSVQRGEFNMFGWREGSHTVYGKTLGIVGLGRIGKRVAHLGSAFGCRVLYNDIVPATTEFEARYQLGAVSFETILAESDILTVHVPLTDLTATMFDAAAFSKMKPGSLYINASRGGTYDTQALYDALVANHLRGAGIDVFNPEPLPVGHPILQLPNVVVTPHIASGTVERQYAINRAQLANFQRRVNGEPLHDLVPEHAAFSEGADSM